jgi:fructuronate reductase/mannitol 2-dehydrogenase
LPNVELPRYHRAALSPGVVHFGPGGFHRAHQAAYFHDLAQRGLSYDWGVIGVSCQSGRTKAALASQDHLYTLVERSAAGDRARVIGSMVRARFAPEERVDVLADLVDPRTRLVTLTITGGGYETPTAPSDRPTPFDLIAEALACRRRAGIEPFTVLSCDNVPANGQATREATLVAAGRRDDLLARWIDRNVAFPGSVVDRITPQVTDETRGLVSEHFGLVDACPVVAEPFSQWVIEDAFCNQRPPLDALGALFVPDVATHELTKKRMLNGGHSALGYIGALLGHRTTDAAMEDPAVRRGMERLLAEEIEQLLPGRGTAELREYRSTLLERFANPRLGDQLARLCGRGSTKLPAYLLPSLEEARRRGTPYRLLGLAVACWIVYLRGRDLDGRTLEIKEARLDELQPLALSCGTDPRPLLGVRSMFGDLGRDQAVVACVEGALRDIDSDGLRATLSRYVTEAPDALEVAA